MRPAFVLVIGLYGILDYFGPIPSIMKLVAGIVLTLLTIPPATISFLWWLHDLWLHPFSRLKYISYGLASYFLADAFQSVIDHAALTQEKSIMWRMISYIVYSDPFTHSYRRVYYSFAHVVHYDEAKSDGGVGDKLDRTVMFIEGAYDDVISVGGQRLCLVDMAKVSNKEFYHSKWGTPATHCLHLEVLSAGYEKHKILSNPEAVQVVQKMLGFWAANPNRPIFKSYDADSKKAICPTLYQLYCAIDDDIVQHHRIIRIGEYVHVG